MNSSFPHSHRAWASSLSALVTLVLLFVGTWAWYYGNASYGNADFTTVEGIYRDVALGSGSLWDWYLPRSSYYLDIFLYFAARAVGGDVHNGLALFAAAQACLVVAGASYALSSVSSSRPWRLPLVALVYSLAVHAPVDVGERWLSGNMAHVLTLAAVFWCLGLFVRSLRRERTSWLLLLLVALMTLCDFIFVLWFVLPALTVLGLRIVLARRWNARPLWLLAFSLCAMVVLGKAIDALTRAYPAAGVGTFKPQIIFSVLPEVLAESADIARAVPLLTAFWCAGLCLFLYVGCTYVKKRLAGELHGALSLFALFCVVFNALAIASFSMFNTYYYLMCYYIPLLLGFPLLPEMLGDHLAQKWRGKGGSFPRVGAALAAACCLGLLASSAVSDVLARKTPYYPPLARCFDRLALSRPEPFSLLASYWSIHDAFFAKTAAVQGRNVFKSLLPYELNTNPKTQPDVSSGILLSPGGYWEGIDTELAHRLNGEPDEIFACPEAGGDYAIWLYKNGARALAPEDTLFDGARLVPEQAQDDVLLWQGRYSFAKGLVLTRVRTALRWNERWCVLEFADTPEKMARTDAAGTRIGVEFMGDRSPKHRRKMAARLGAAPDGALAPLYRLFLHSRFWESNENPVYALPGGGSAIFFKIPSRHSTAWPFFEVNVGEEAFEVGQSALP